MENDGTFNSDLKNGMEGAEGTEDGEAKNYNEKVDLNDLDWEDRERVLRLLFSKINSGAPPVPGRAESR